MSICRINSGYPLLNEAVYIGNTRTDRSNIAYCGRERGRGSLVKIRGLTRIQNFRIRTPLVQTILARNLVFSNCNYRPFTEFNIKCRNCARLLQHSGTQFRFWLHLCMV